MISFNTKGYAIFTNAPPTPFFATLLYLKSNLYNFRIMRFLQRPENALNGETNVIIKKSGREESLVEQYTIDYEYLAYFCQSFYYKFKKNMGDI